MTLKRILITGAAGFIGYHTALNLLKQGLTVYGLDNLNSYYDTKLKDDRLKQLAQYPGFVFERVDIADGQALERFWQKHGPFTHVIHLAAQAGVRFSVQNPQVYVESNLMGFTNILERCRYNEGLQHLVYASTSSVYGANEVLPFQESHAADRPISFYAATKRANELMAQSYFTLYNLPVTGLRYFTVYGPWGRPDMALFRFTKAIIEGEPIQVFNHGQMVRDFTFIDDIVDGTLLALAKTPTAYTRGATHPLYNLGNANPRQLMDFINVLEDTLHKKAHIEYKDMQLGDVAQTASDSRKAQAELEYNPRVSIEEGIAQFVSWYREYYRA